MITRSNIGDSGFERVDDGIEGWIDAVAPTRDEIEELKESFGIPADFIDDSLDPDQVSLIEKDDGALRVIIRVPRFVGPEHNPPHVTAPVGIVLTEDRLVTISPVEHELFRHLPHGHGRKVETSRPTTVLLLALWSVANSFLRRLAEIEKTVEGLEDRLAGSQRNREVLELLRHQKSLEHFTYSLQGNEIVLDRLKEGELIDLGGDVGELLQDVVIEHRQANGRVEIASNVLSNMMDAFASIISNNLNVVMKLLTSLTIVLIVLTVFATFYGMNVPLPFEESPWAFPVIVVVSVLTALGVALLFWKKDWL
jgi:magnesium transporter